MSAHNERWLPVFNFFMWTVCGMPGLAAMFYLQQNLGLQPWEFGFTSHVATLPWIVKPLWGILCDLNPIGGERRRSYILLSCIVYAGAWSSMASGRADLTATVVALFLSSLAMAVADVAVDAMVVDVVRTERGADVGNMQARIALARTLGSAAGSGISFVYFVVQNDPLHLFAATSGAAWLLLVGALLCLRDSKPREMRAYERSGCCKTLCQHLGKCVETLRQREVYGPIAFVVLWGCVPCSGTGMWYYITESSKHGGLGMPKSVVALINIASGVAAAVGIAMYRKIMHTVSLRRFLAVAIVVTAALSLAPIVVIEGWNGDVSPIWFIFGDDVLLSAMFRVTLLPISIICASRCPSGAEGTVYAGMMSIVNAAEMLGDLLGSALTAELGIVRDTSSGIVNFENMTTLIVICSSCMLLPNVLLKLLPQRLPASESVETAEFGIVDDGDLSSDDEINVELPLIDEATETTEQVQEQVQEQEQAQEPDADKDKDEDQQSLIAHAANV